MALHSNEQLYAYYAFLISDKNTPRPGELMNLDRMNEELAQGLYLQSNIPSGYGLGSSGALVAALYDKYAGQPPGSALSPMDLQWLKAFFSRLESYFHGSSSGIDPLSIFVSKPLLIGAEQKLSLPGLPQNLSGQKGGFFLINTRIPRKTSDLIAVFKNKINDPAFKKVFFTDYIECNDTCLRTIARQQEDPEKACKLMEEQMLLLSQLQFDLFREMIPDIFRPLWQDGLKTGVFSMKLCGAGGGGYLLGYASDYAKASGIWKKHTVEAVRLNGDKINLP